MTTDNPDTVDHEARRLRDDYGVAFVKLGDGPLEIWGSGTLVTVGGRRGILTADHVVTALQGLRWVGLLCPNRRNETTLCPRFGTADAAAVRIGNASMTEDGPDLAVLFPPPDVIGTLAAHKSHYNLDLRQAQMLDSPPEIDSGTWLLAGAAAEWVERAGEDNPPWFDFKVGRTAIGPPMFVGGYDYVDAGSLESAETDSPRSYGGFSGGALWQVIESDGEVTSLLSGVAFFQSEKRSGVRRIRCHFRRSIYERVLNGIS